MSTSQNQLATAALETLHGARSLPPAEATAKLRDFADSIGTALTSDRPACGCVRRSEDAGQPAAIAGHSDRRHLGIRDRNNAELCQRIRLILAARPPIFYIFANVRTAATTLLPKQGFG